MLGSPLPDSKFWVACVRLSSSSSPTSPSKALEVPENARTSGDARKVISPVDVVLELSDGFRTSAVRSGHGSGIAARVLPIVACMRPLWGTRESGALGGYLNFHLCRSVVGEGCQDLRRWSGVWWAPGAGPSATSRRAWTRYSLSLRD